jgi:hypothetical protein
MTQKEKALAHVRSVCPELMELRNGCTLHIQMELVRIVLTTKDGTFYCDDGKFWTREMLEQNRLIKIIGHTPQLQHWLMGITSAEWIDLKNDRNPDGSKERLYVQCEKKEIGWNFGIYYDLTKDGDNQSEEFYQAYNQIVGI